MTAAPTIPTFSGTDANLAIVRYFGSGKAADFPTLAFDQLAAALAGGNLMFTLIDAMEAFYAARAELDDEGAALLSGLARFVGDKNFAAMQVRAYAIDAVAARLLAGGDTAVEDDPDVDARLQPMADEPAPAAPVS